jgi:prepilin-type N-terminal cleavage/methylation domain-containing protein
MQASRRCMSSTRAGLDFGYTMIELAMAVAVAGVISFASLSYVPKLYDEIELSRFNQRLSGWVLAIENTFLSRYDYIGLSLQSIVELGLLDKERVELNALGDVVSVRHLYGGALNASVLTTLGDQFWGAHLSGIPSKACLPVLQSMGAIGHQVMVVNEQAGVSALTEWIGTVGLNAAKTNIVNFPSRYQVVKTLDRVQLSVSELIGLCRDLNGQRMGLVLIRKKM